MTEQDPNATAGAQAPANEPVKPAEAPAPAQGANTAVSKPQNPLDKFAGIRDRCVKMYGSADRFTEEATFLLGIVANTPTLWGVVPASISGVLLASASTGLSLSPIKKEAYVIPRKVKIKTPGQPDRWESRAIFDPSYIGLMKAATDSGAVRNFESHDVYLGDYLEYDLIAGKPKVHRPYWTMGNQRGQLVGVYGWAVLHDGTIIPDHMGADELEKIQSKSDNKDGAIYQDWKGEMARKSLLKRICKHVPRTERMAGLLEAIDQDNQQFDLSAPKAIDQGIGPIMAECRTLLDAYTGTDKELYKKRMADEALSGRQDMGFWMDMRDFLSGKSGQ